MILDTYSLLKDFSKVLFKDSNYNYDLNYIMVAAEILSYKIKKLTNSNTKSVVIASNSSHHIPIAIVAIWINKLTPIFPNGLRVDSIGSIISSESDIILVDQGYSINLSEQKQTYNIINLVELDEIVKSNPRSTNQLMKSTIHEMLSDYVAKEFDIVMYTSGSTGQPKQIVRTLYSYIQESNLIIDLIPNIENCNLCVATVPTFHAYGFMFRIVLPILHNITIWEKMITYEEEFSNIDRSNNILLVSNPGFLKRVNVEISKNNNIETVISAGGVLTNDVLNICANKIKSCLFEILGSTETGAMAYRLVNKIDDKWNTIPGTKLYITDDSSTLKTVGSGTLCYDSPYLPPKLLSNISNCDVLKTEDSIELDVFGKFKFLGRVSRTIKIEDTRISLDQIEKELMKLNDINDCAVIKVINGNREYTAAMIVLSEEGKFNLSSQSIGKYFIELRKQIKNIDPIAIPKYFVIENQIPLSNTLKVAYPKITEIINEKLLHKK